MRSDPKVVMSDPKVMRYDRLCVASPIMPLNQSFKFLFTHSLTISSMVLVCYCNFYVIMLPAVAFVNPLVPSVPKKWYVSLNRCNFRMNSHIFSNVGSCDYVTVLVKEAIVFFTNL